MYTFTKNDFAILRVIYNKKATTELLSISIKTIQEETKLSAVKIRATLKLFLNEGYIKHGLRKTNALTYYITKDGCEKIKDLMGVGNNVN